jgi:hypothetical protein
MGVSGQRHALAALYFRESPPGAHFIGDWVGFGAGLYRGQMSSRKVHVCYKLVSN